MKTLVKIKNKKHMIVNSIKIIISILISVLFLACSKKPTNSHSVPEVELISFATPTFQSNNYLTNIEDFGYHKIEYIGKGNPIIIDSKVSLSQQNEEYSFPSKQDINIIVNTNQIISIQNQRTGNDYLAYPIIIKNISEKALRIGIGETLSLSLLAKTKNQNWRIVTKSNYYDGMEPVIIKTNELVVTYCGITNGSIDADFKYILVIGDSMIESNIFSGRINKKIID